MTACKKCYCLLLLLTLTLNYSDEFEVKVADSPVTGIYGQYVVLCCSFTVNKDNPVEGIIITWQNAKSAEVMHSFYYGKNQLERQSLRFFNRTSLYPSEFKHGNASLKLERVSTDDLGEYTCFVNNVHKSGEATLQLSIAAFFTSPVLVIKLQPHTMTFIFHSEGYPKPEIEWQSSDGENISKLLETSFQQSENSLYQVTSSLTVHLQSNATYSFILRNKALNQTITNVFSLLPGGELENENAGSRQLRWTLALPVAFLLLVIVILLCRNEKLHSVQNKACSSIFGGR